MWCVDGLLLLLAYGDLAGKIFPSWEEWLKKFAVLSDLPWYWKIIILLIANLALIGKGSLGALRKRELQRDRYALQLQEIEDAKPHIIPNEPGAAHVEKIAFVDRITGHPVGTFVLVKVRFINKPHHNVPGSYAKMVGAKVSFYDSETNHFLMDMDGRWDTTDQPSTREFGKSRNDLLAIDFRIGAAHGLDIAIWDAPSGMFYAYNNDSSDYPGHKKPDYALTGESFLVKIQLNAEWVKEEFSFQFTRDAQHGARIVSPMQPSVPYIQDSQMR